MHKSNSLRMIPIYLYKDIFLTNKPILSGFYGEGVPFQSQMTVAIKSHGFTTGTFARKALNAPESTRKLNNHLKELNSTAILLIRNPFKAIIGHRHLDEGGHTGHAPAKSFLGPGWCFFYVEAFTVFAKVDFTSSFAQTLARIICFSYFD